MCLTVMKIMSCCTFFYCFCEIHPYAFPSSQFSVCFVFVVSLSLSSVHIQEQCIASSSSPPPSLYLNDYSRDAQVFTVQPFNHDVSLCSLY